METITMRPYLLISCLSFAVASGCAGSSSPPVEQTRQRADSGTDGYATWFSLKVHYVRMGQETVPDGGTPAKKRVVLLHYAAMDSSEWSQAQSTLAANYDVVAVDLFGHGKSDCLDKMTSIGMQGELVTTVMDSLGWDSAHLVGVGLGARVAATIAKYSASRVKSLTIMSADGLTAVLAPAYPDFAPPNLPVAPIEVNPLFEFPPVCVPACTVNPALWPPGSVMATKQAFGLMLQKNNAMVTDQFAQQMFQAELNRSCFIVNERMGRNGNENFGDYLALDDLKKFTVPALILWGDADKILTPAKWTGAWSTIPGSSVKMLSGCGHDLPRDCPADVAAAVKTFIDAH